MAKASKGSGKGSGRASSARPAEQSKGKSGSRKQKKQKGKGKTKPNSSSRRRDLFSPWNDLLVPVISSEGKAFPTRGIVRDDATISASTFMYIATNGGVSGTVLGAVVNSAAPSLVPFTIPTLALSDSSGGPTSGRAMKLGLTLVNTTKVLDQGGRLYILHSNQRFSLPAAPSAMTQAQWTTFFGTVKDHPDTTPYQGADFSNPKAMVSHPISDPDYHDYNQWVGTETFDQFAAHWATWSGASVRNRPMSTIVILFEIPSASQSYTVSVSANFYTRWPITSIPGQHSTYVPTAPAAVLNSHKVATESRSSVLHDASEISGGALAGAAATAALLGRMAGQGAALAEAALPYAELAVPLLV